MVIVNSNIFFSLFMIWLFSDLKLYLLVSLRLTLKDIAFGP